MDVGDWLRSLGLGQYLTLFREHEIDADVLPELTDADLEKLGVPLGHRKRLFKAIAILATAAPEQREAATAQPAAPIADAAAERRHLAVLFCDLVGSTTISAGLDAEDWRNLVNGYLDAASEAVVQMGGRVANKLGDGLMALFGHPIAQENDSERAVRAALAIQRALADLNGKSAGRPKLVARIGIETGAVVVDAAGEIFGDAPNTAARVQTLAEPGTVLVTGRVQRQVAGLFVAEDRGAHELKGVPAPVAIYRVVRASGGRRFGARALTPFVGREEELDLLRRRWERAVKGEGQLALVLGEPGIGKSRLVEEFRLKLGETPHTFVEWSSSQLLQNTPLHPIVEWGRQRFGADEPPNRRLADLESTLRLIGLDPAEYAPLLAPLVEIPLPEKGEAKFAPEEFRRRQLAALASWVLAGARSQPVVLAFEDLHWADPTSLDLMTRLAEHGHTAPLLIIVTARSEFLPPPWSPRSHHCVISLIPLDRADVAQMVGELAAGHTLGKEVVEGVSERAGGVPLFVEEVTRLLIERGDAGGLQAIPSTLQQSLAARLDRVGEAREVAQIGAVLGRSFSYALLQAVAGLDDTCLHTSLRRLAEADHLFVEGPPPQAIYRFKHALIQDAAYDSLLKSRRRALHRRAAEILRDGGAEPEAIAYHFTGAGLDNLAIEWWGKAGDQALRRSAFREAIAHLGKAIEMADKEGGERAVRVSGQRQLHLHVAYGNALISARGFGALETTEAFARARESAYDDRDAPERLAADYGLWAGSWMRGELPSMRTRAAAFVRDVEAEPDSPEVSVAHRVLGATHWFAGEYAEARDHLERALELFQPGRDDDLAFRFGQDVGVAAMLYLALALWPLGEVGRAISLVGRAEARVARLAHIGTQAYCKLHAALFQLLRGDRVRAAACAAELARLAREHDLLLYGAFGAFLGGLATGQSDATGGIEEMRRGVDLLRKQNVLSYDGLLKIALVEAENGAGDVYCALAILDEALAATDRTGHRAFDAELHRKRGEMLLKRDPANPAPAEEAFHTAIAIARRQGTRSFELRAALSLAKLYQSTSRPASALAVLAPALEGFSPTPEMPEIAEAAALLAALAETEAAKVAAASRKRRLQLQTGYGLALTYSHGVAAEETKAAATRTKQLAVEVNDPAARFAVYYAEWLASLIGGQMGSARTTAETSLGEARNVGDLPHIASASRMLGHVRMLQGVFTDAREHLEEALRLYNPTWGIEVTRSQTTDWEITATVLLGVVSWQLGDVSRARGLIEQSKKRADESQHGVTLANAYMFSTIFEVFRGDAEATLRGAKTLAEVATRMAVQLYSSAGEIQRGWARARLGDRETGLEESRQGLAEHAEQKALVLVPFYRGLIAQLEAEEPDGVLPRIEGALALAEQTGEHWTDAFLHRIRGDILLKVDPENSARAEEAFLTATAIAREQGARSFGLQAALNLAKLYQSTDRPVEAHETLAPALEGFAPTPEMSEIAEAQALLTALAETGEVKNAAATRQRRLQLQTGYSQALMWSRGAASEEAKAAFAHAQELAKGVDKAGERFDAYYGLFAGSLLCGELPSARETAETFLRETEKEARTTEAAAARRCLGLACVLQGDLAVARAHFEQALRIFDPERDREAKFRFGMDTRVGATVFLAITNWLLGEAGPAGTLIEEAIACAVESAHATTMANVYLGVALFNALRVDAEDAQRATESVLEISRAHGLGVYLAAGRLASSWACSRLGDRAGTMELRQALAAYADRGNKMLAPFFRGLLAEFEAEAQDAEGALARIDEALALAEQTGEHWTDAFLHRIRGDILLKAEPENPARAEEAYRTAIAVAREQGARSFGLQAALNLAKLYQSTGRPVEAHETLAPALEGFAPTPEMSEIAEAQALLRELAGEGRVAFPRVGIPPTAT